MADKPTSNTYSTLKVLGAIAGLLAAVATLIGALYPIFKSTTKEPTAEYSGTLSSSKPTRPIPWAYLQLLGTSCDTRTNELGFFSFQSCAGAEKLTNPRIRISLSDISDPCPDLVALRPLPQLSDIELSPECVAVVTPGASARTFATAKSTPPLGTSPKPWLTTAPSPPTATMAFDPMDCFQGEIPVEMPNQKARILGFLEAYYHDLKFGDFDANRYFAPRVIRYFLMKNTTTGAINSYIHHEFPKQFLRNIFNMQPDSLRIIEQNTAVYIEHDQYYLVALHQNKDVVTCVRIEFDDAGRLVSLYQPRVLSSRVLSEE